MWLHFWVVAAVIHTYLTLRSTISSSFHGSFRLHYKANITAVQYYCFAIKLCGGGRGGVGMGEGTAVFGRTDTKKQMQGICRDLCLKSIYLLFANHHSQYLSISVSSSTLECTWSNKQTNKHRHTKVQSLWNPNPAIIAQHYHHQKPPTPLTPPPPKQEKCN